MSTPERQQDPGEHGYGGVHGEKEHDGQDHAPDDPDADPRQAPDDPEDAPEPREGSG